MAHEMRLLEQEFADAPVEFVGVFPNPSTRPDQMAQFGETYGLDMDLVADTAGWAGQLGARWTPEAIVLDERDSVVRGASMTGISRQESDAPEPATGICAMH